MALHFGKTGAEAAWDAAGNLLLGAAATASVYLVAYDGGKPIRGSAATGLLDATGIALADNNITANATGQFEWFGPGEITDADPVTKYILATPVGDWLVETTQMDEIVAWLRGRLATAETTATDATTAANDATAAVTALQNTVDALDAQVGGLTDSHASLSAKAIVVRNGAAFGVGTVGANHPVLDETTLTKYDLIRVLSTPPA